MKDITKIVFWPITLAWNTLFELSWFTIIWFLVACSSLAATYNTEPIGYLTTTLICYGLGMPIFAAILKSKFNSYHAIAANILGGVVIAVLFRLLINLLINLL